jgi:integrase/recombinase XerD
LDQRKRGATIPAENVLSVENEPEVEQPNRARPFDLARHFAGLPDWLVTGLERYQGILLRNWRPTRRAQNIQRFWSEHLRAWRFFCEKCEVQTPGELKNEHVLAYIDARLQAGSANSSLNTELSSLRAFLRFLHEEGLPIADGLLRIPGLKQPDLLPRALTDEQVRKVRDEIAAQVTKSNSFHKHKDTLMAKAAYTLLWQGGLRLGEVEALRLEDVDLNAKMLIVRDGKGLKDRVVYLSEAVIAALRDYLAVRGTARNSHVFLYHNAPLKKDLLRRRFQAAGKQVGVKVKIHGLRHACATQLLNVGCPITSIQAILGHKKLDTTLIYARVHDKTVEQDYFRAMGRQQPL